VINKNTKKIDRRIVTGRGNLGKQVIDGIMLKFLQKYV